jgi:hypothetical protein
VNYIYDGMATVDFGNSPADPLRSIPVLGVEAVYYLDFRFTLGWGRILHDYLRG